MARLSFSVSVIGKEIKKQMKNVPDTVIACVGGGSNAIGTFYPMIDDSVEMIGVEAAGKGLKTGMHSATLNAGKKGVLHGGAHKINNTLGQALLAKKMKKKRIIAETGAGQHGVATAMACSCLGLPSEVYMGYKDTVRQQQNVFRMDLLGCKI